MRIAGVKNIYDLRAKNAYSFTAIDEFFNFYQVKRELGVSQDITWSHCNTAVHMAMIRDKPTN